MSTRNIKTISQKAKKTVKKASKKGREASKTISQKAKKAVKEASKKGKEAGKTISQKAKKAVKKANPSTNPKKKSGKCPTCGS